MTMLTLSLTLLLQPVNAQAPPSRQAEDAVQAMRRHEVRASVFTRGRQEHAALDAAGDRTYVVWSSARQEAGSSGIYGRVFDPAARPASHERHLNHTIAGDQVRPSVAALPDGTGAWVAWVSRQHRRTRIVARRFDAEFTASGREISVAASDAPLSDPVIVAGPDGGAFISWVAHQQGAPTGPSSAIAGQSLDAHGRLRGPALALAHGHRDSVPSLARLDDHRLLVVWARAGKGIYGREIAGHATGPEQLLGPTEAGACPPIEPSVDALTGDGFALAWMACERPGYAVWAQRFNSDLTPSTAPLWIAGPDSGWKSGVSVTASPDNRLLVSYNSDGDGGSDLWARLVAADASLGSPQRVQQASSGRQALTAASGARRSLWTVDGQLAWAWQGASPDDATAAHLTSWTLKDRQLPPALDLGTARAAEVVGSARLARARPIFNPDFEPQEPLAGAQHGSDFGFEPIQQAPWTPPDPEIAVGPSMLLFMTNGAIAAWDKSGGFLWQDEIENTFGFWGELGADNLVFDPEVTWDEHSGRFFAMANEDADDGTPYFLLAVSMDASPDDRDDWHKYRFDVSTMAGGSTFIDSPNMAVNRDFVLLTADFFGPDKYLMFVIDKASILGGGAAVTANDLIVGTQSMGIPNVRSDTSTLYIVESTEFGTNDTVILHAITDPLGTFTRVTETVTVPTYTFPADPPQSGTSSRPELFEPRFWSVTERDGSIWAVHHVDSTRARVRWYEFSLNGWPLVAGETSVTGVDSEATEGLEPTLAQVGEIDLGEAVSTFFPSIDVDDQNAAAITFARSSPTEFFSIWRAVRTAADPPNTFQPAVEVQVSANPSTSGRWGDYSGTEADPVVTGSFWGVHEFTNGSNSSWRTWAARYDVDIGLIFSDGFESGDTAAWSNTVP